MASSSLISRLQVQLRCIMSDIRLEIENGIDSHFKSNYDRETLQDRQ